MPKFVTEISNLILQYGDWAFASYFALFINSSICGMFFFRMRSITPLSVLVSGKF